MKYTYKAFTKNGETQTGSIEASSKEEVTKVLRHRDLIVSSIKSADQTNIFASFSQKVPLKDKTLFTRQLAVMIRSGLPVVQALTALEEQSENANLRKVLAIITQDVKGGMPFSQALAKHPNVFSPLFASVIASGENSGKLEEVLDNLADQQEKDYDIVSKVKGAMIYPIVILCALLGVSLLVVVYIVPQMTSIFTDMGNGSLPLTTQFLMDTSTVIRKYFLEVIIVVAAIVLFLKRYFKTASGRRTLDTIKLKLPVFGTLNKKLYMARFTRTMGMLIGAGLPMIEVIKTSGEIIDNSLYTASVKKMAQDVENGMPLSQSLQKDKNFPGLVSHMIAIGEQSGRMDYVLGQIATFYEKEVDGMTKNLSTLIEPLLMVVMGIGVGFLVISILGPISSLESSL